MTLRLTQRHERTRKTNELWLELGFQQKLDPVCQSLHPGSKEKQFIFSAWCHEPAISLIAYLWMGSFCVPNTDGEVFWRSHKLVFPNLHICSTSNLGLITAHLHTTECPGHNIIHKQSINCLFEKKASLNGVICHPGHVSGLIAWDWLVKQGLLIWDKSHKPDPLPVWLVRLISDKKGSQPYPYEHIIHLSWWH